MIIKQERVDPAGFEGDPGRDRHPHIPWKVHDHNTMKNLALLRNPPSDKVTVQCADGEVSVYTHCAYCTHCSGVRVGKRTIPSPILQSYREVRRGTGPDEALMSAAMMFNTVIRDGDAIECDDDGNEGFSSLYHHC
jgi:hypothetical protein